MEVICQKPDLVDTDHCLYHNFRRAGGGYTVTGAEKQIHIVNKPAFL